jgi:hypothetical protein
MDAVEEAGHTKHQYPEKKAMICAVCCAEGHRASERPLYESFRNAYVDTLAKLGYHYREPGEVVGT